jgi:hypothetical protein
LSASADECSSVEFLFYFCLSGRTRYCWWKKGFGPDMKTEEEAEDEWKKEEME